MKKVLLSILFVLGSLSIILAQTPTGRLLGTVSSPDGGVLPMLRLKSSLTKQVKLKLPQQAVTVHSVLHSSNPANIR